MVTSIDREETEAGLKPGWRMVRFGDVVSNVDINERDPLANGLERYVGLEHLDPESLHIQRWGLIEEGTSFTRKFVTGQVLFGKRRAYQHKAAVADFDGICSSDILVFEAKENLLPELLPFIVQSDPFYEHALNTSAGSLSPRTKWKDLADYEFALPPKDEQRRIADILWAADESILKMVFLQEQIQSYRQTLVQILFDPYTPKGEEKTVNLVPLAEVLSYGSDGPFGSKLKTEHYTDEGVRVIRLQNIGDGAFNDDDKAYISNAYYRELIRYSVRPGDIIVAGLGDEAHALGRACMIPKDLELAVNKADCFCLRANTSIMMQEYLLYFLNSPYARNQINQLVQGTTRARINVSNLKSITAIIPDSKSQQHTCHILKTLDTAYIRVMADIQVKRNLAVNLREHLLSARRHTHV